MCIQWIISPGNWYISQNCLDGHIWGCFCIVSCWCIDSVYSIVTSCIPIIDGQINICCFWFSPFICYQIVLFTVECISCIFFFCPQCQSVIRCLSAYNCSRPVCQIYVMLSIFYSCTLKLCPYLIPHFRMFIPCKCVCTPFSLYVSYFYRSRSPWN